MVVSDEERGLMPCRQKRRKTMKKDIMRSLWRAYVTGDEKAFDRVSLRAFREPEQETEQETKITVSDIEVVDFCGEE